jgi:uncharacterized membrane protein
MDEGKQIAIIVILGLALATVGVAVTSTLKGFGMTGPAVVSSYEARLSSNGTLREDYSYTFTVQQYRMLYRSWEAPVSLTPQGSPYIKPVQIDPPLGSVAYIKDRFGDVTIETPNSNPIVIATIDSLAEYNEVGCYYASKFPPGSYKIGYTFNLYPPIEYDSNYDHLNLLFADIHIPYTNVKIVIEDASYVAAVYPHPPSLRVTQTGNQIMITGSAAEDELLEVELLMKPGVSHFNGFRTLVQDVREKTESANFWYSLQYNAATWIGYAAILVVFAVPLLLLWTYMRFGREEDVTIPTYLSTVPNKDRKPWLVNLVFRKEISDFDEDGFYATLLDLHLRKKLRIEPREHGMKIHILDSNVDDAYEGKVIGFLQKLSTNGVFDTDTLSDLAMTSEAGRGAMHVALRLKGTSTG